MKTGFFLIAVTVAAILGGEVGATVIHPGLSNPGFELGDLTDWTTSRTTGVVQVVATAQSLDGARYDGIDTWLPREGGKFALIRGGTAGVYQKLSTSFAAAAGDLVVFNVFFDTNETGARLPLYNDDGYAKIVNTTTLVETTLFASSVATLPFRGNSGWTGVSFIIPATGNYRLEFGVRNVTDNTFIPQLGVDFMTFPPVPFTASLTSVTAGEMHIHFVADTGLNYTIQYKNALTDATWLHLADIAAPSAPLDVDYNDTSVAAVPRRFYRIVTPLTP